MTKFHSEVYNIIKFSRLKVSFKKEITMPDIEKVLKKLNNEQKNLLIEYLLKLQRLEKKSQNQSNVSLILKKNIKWRKIATAILLVLVILFASLFGAFAFSSDFRHAAVEVFEDEGDDYSRVSSASADRGTADAVTFTFINYTAINCKGGRKGMEASFLAKP